MRATIYLQIYRTAFDEIALQVNSNLLWKQRAAKQKADANELPSSSTLLLDQENFRVRRYQSITVALPATYDEPAASG